MIDLLLAGSLAAAFAAGMVAFFAPCCAGVMMPAYLAAIGGGHRIRVARLTAVYVAGVSLVVLPITLGAAALASYVTRWHAQLFTVGGLMMIGVAIALWRGTMLPIDLPQPKLTGSSLSVFGLGAFSGAATACCAPVLAGAIALSATSGTIAGGMLLGVAYVAGMMVPLVPLALVYGRARTRVRDPVLTLRLGQRSKRIGIARLTGSVVFAGFGVLFVALALTGNSDTAPGFQKAMGSWMRTLAARSTASRISFRCRSCSRWSAVFSSPPSGKEVTEMNGKKAKAIRRAAASPAPRSTLPNASFLRSWKGGLVGLVAIAVLAGSFVLPDALSTKTTSAGAQHAMALGAAEGSGLPVGATVPTFSERDLLGGAPITSKTVYVKKTLLFFSEGVMCQACFEQIQGLQRLGTELTRRSIQLISVTPDSSSELRRAIRQYGITTPVISDSDRSLSEAFNTLGRGMHGDTPGHAFALISKGKVLWYRDYWLAPYRTMYVQPTKLLADIPPG